METFGRREPAIDLGRGLAGARCERPLPPPPSRDRTSRLDSGRGCGNRLRRNTRHENNRNSECTSEAERDAVGASETRINTRLFTYGVRVRGSGEGSAAGEEVRRPPAIRALQLLALHGLFHLTPN